MNKFLLFAGEEFYPGGGWSDFVGAYPTQHEAKEAATKQQGSWWQIVDVTTLLVVANDFDVEGEE